MRSVYENYALGNVNDMNDLFHKHSYIPNICKEFDNSLFYFDSKDDNNYDLKSLLDPTFAINYHDRLKKEKVKKFYISYHIQRCRRKR